jgi:ribosomal protein L20
MKENDGVYPTEISSKAKMESAMAIHDPEAFRKLLVNYGKIEVV